MCDHLDRDIDGEKDLCRQILIVAIKDAISTDNKKYAAKYRNDAIRWFKSEDESKMFSFNRIVEYVFGQDADVEAIRERILKLIENTKVSGVKNLSTIFQGLDDE